MHLAYFPTGNASLKFNFNGMPVADGSFGWQWLSTELAGVGEIFARKILFFLNYWGQMLSCHL